jgi:hypothetical protein
VAGLSTQSKWTFVLPALHLGACLTTNGGVFIPGLRPLGFLFGFILLIDLPVSIVACMAAWAAPALAVICVLVVCTAWWYFLNRVIVAVVRGRREAANGAPSLSNQSS